MRKFIQLVIVVLLMFGMFALQANDTFASKKSNDKVMTFKTMTGHVLDGKTNKSKLSQVFLRNFSMTLNNGSSEINGDVLNKNQKFELSTTGSLYPVKGKGVYANKVILGEYNTSSKINLIQFRVEKDARSTHLIQMNKADKGKTILSLTLEDMDTGDLYVFQKTINTKTFNTLLERANQHVALQNLTEKQLNEKTSSLMNFNNFKKKNKSKMKKSESTKQSFDYDSSTDKNTKSGFSAMAGASVSYYDLDKVLKDVKQYGTIDLDNYNVSHSIFKDGGWKQYHQLSTHPRFFYHASTQEYSGAYGYSTTQINFVDVIAQTSGSDSYEVQTQLKHAIMLDYDHYSHELSVVYYALGLEFKNIELAINKLNDKNVFIDRWVSGILEGSPSYVKGAMSLVPYASTAYGLWDNFTTKETHQLNTLKTFDNTYDKQYQRHNGEVIRGVLGDYSGYSMEDEGQYAILRGGMYTPTTWSLTWGYSYTAYSR
ncbi:hypothetical protein [Pseudalkalibacillus sp. SCS-8]|uniref:hypothetical protein n=1 Tax=Pseudalkalibacillus nanhaiensis TaxID=3115291 RepID=UPI0032DA1F80